MNRRKIGSLTAKGGFLNEERICEKFLDYQNDIVVQEWLDIMGYDFKKISRINAIQIPPRISADKAIKLGVSEENLELSLKHKKADIQIRLDIEIDKIHYIENISLKKAKVNANFNQVDKRPVSTYKKIWGFDDDIERWLKIFTGEIPPQSFLDKNDLETLKDKKKRRLFLHEIPVIKCKKILEFFNKNKFLVISDLLKGRGALSAEWLLVTKQKSNKLYEWVLTDINTAINFFSDGEVKLTPRGSLKIGKITMQRKGGTPDPKSLQFKIKPLEVFDDR